MDSRLQNCQASLVEIHPYPQFLPDGIQTLIIGSFPPIKLTRKYQAETDCFITHLYNLYLLKQRKTTRDIDFYYGSTENHFWKICEEIFQTTLKDKQTILSFLTQYRIGVTDVAQECLRKVINTKTGKPINPSEADQESGFYSVSSSDSCLVIIKQRNILQTVIDNRSIEKLVFTGRIAYNTFIRSLPDSVSVVENELMVDKSRTTTLYLLPSPSGAANKSIGALQKFQLRNDKDKSYNTFRYRVDKYREALK